MKKLSTFFLPLGIIFMLAPAAEETAAQIRESGGEAIFVRADVTSPEEVETIVMLVFHR